MPEKGAVEYRAYHEQAVLVIGFLGAIMFAALILILQSSAFSEQAHSKEADLALAVGPFVAQWYTEIMETIIASLVAISAVTSLASMRTLSHELKNPRGQEVMYEFVDWSLIIIFIGFGNVVGLILLPFTPIGGWFAEGVFALFFSIFAILFVWARKSPKGS